MIIRSSTPSSLTPCGSKQSILMPPGLRPEGSSFPRFLPFRRELSPLSSRCSAVPKRRHWNYLPSILPTIIGNTATVTAFPWEAGQGLSSPTRFSNLTWIIRISSQPRFTKTGAAKCGERRDVFRGNLSSCQGPEERRRTMVSS